LVLAGVFDDAYQFVRADRARSRSGFADAGDAGISVAREIADLIRQRASEGRKCVLGLPTGSTPTGVYAELVRLHQQEALS
jgi:glucosamine-6-phosphate deaminase